MFIENYKAKISKEGCKTNQVIFWHFEKVISYYIRYVYRKL